MSMFAHTLPLSLYVHIPWCVRKCPYCDFNSHEAREGIPEAAYVDALLADLEFDLSHTHVAVPVQSIFIGGGTPSLFSPESIEALLNGIQRQVQLDTHVEITLEANPGTVEVGKFAEFHAAGINRLSIGIQSFQDDYLARLGRIHSSKEAVRAAEQAHDAGFASFNLDLMFGLPGQNIQQAMRDVKMAIDLEPNHISWYQLTLEPNTLFYKQPPQLPDDETLWSMQEQGQRYLEQAGYSQYEVSAYAQSEHQSRHNLNYWLFGDYLGIGAGAHSKYTDIHSHVIRRIAKARHPRDYMERAGDSTAVSTPTTLTTNDIILEFMMNALRLKRGFPSGLFEQRTGLTIESIDSLLQSARAKGWLDIDTEGIRPSRQGFRYLNDLIALFLQD